MIDLTHTLAVPLVLCGIADVVTTYMGLKSGDEEANPVASRLFKLVGVVPGMIGLKATTTAVLLGVMLYTDWWEVGALALAGYAYVLWNNVRVLSGD